MAMEPKTKRIIIISIAGLFILGIIAWFIYKSIPHEQGGGAPPVSTTTTQPGLLELASGFISGGWIKNLFGGGKKYETTGCDPNKPGYNLDGLYDNNCQ